jgi:outer membrane protein assembly factor BamE (lipoprotein component of BamABCDE complex)
MKAAVVKGATALVGAALLAGCAGFREHRGYVMDKELVSAVQVGVDNKESVERTLGRPTFTGTFDQNDWYYVARDTAQLAFRRPRVTDQTVLHVRFDQAGNVVAVEQTDETLVASINPSGDRTPTLGRQRGFFEELLNNVGTISQPGLPGSQEPR